jgi:hypothetical protein
LLFSIPFTGENFGAKFSKGEITLGKYLALFFPPVKEMGPITLGKFPALFFSPCKMDGTDNAGKVPSVIFSPCKRDGTDNAGNFPSVISPFEILAPKFSPVKGMENHKSRITLGNTPRPP